jgi:hypothetical protein
MTTSHGHLHCIRDLAPDAARFAGPEHQPEGPLSRAELDRLLERTPLGRQTLRDRAERQRQAGTLRDHGRAQLGAAGASLAAEEQPLPASEVKRLAGLSRGGYFHQWKERLHGK